MAISKGSNNNSNKMPLKFVMIEWCDAFINTNMTENDSNQMYMF